MRFSRQLPSAAVAEATGEYAGSGERSDSLLSSSGVRLIDALRRRIAFMEGAWSARIFSKPMRLTRPSAAALVAAPLLVRRLYFMR
ncbi:hypothetical protein JIQ42_05941 [Leishmania sp. Namibia]|uniref:hypothetical protein n=1 Tax=Leishmania sp. Namibia TaxID=2802991 RepID=UPI001B6B603E|nr:hypothetical protein JIQ42_05941 [Leishmania sp. Namibia]